MEGRREVRMEGEGGKSALEASRRRERKRWREKQGVI